MDFILAEAVQSIARGQDSKKKDFAGLFLALQWDQQLAILALLVLSALLVRMLLKTLARWLLFGTRMLFWITIAGAILAVVFKLY